MKNEVSVFSSFQESLNLHPNFPSSGSFSFFLFSFKDMLVKIEKSMFLYKDIHAWSIATLSSAYVVNWNKIEVPIS